MRLTATEQDQIKQAVRSWFGAGSQALLFGSRTDDSKRGGDIDLIVQLEKRPDDWYTRKLSLLADLKTRLGDQRIDIVFVDQDTAADSFAATALEGAVVL